METKELKIGDRVRIADSPVKNDPIVGKISTITKISKDPFGDNIYTLDNPNRDLSYVNWTAEYLEKVSLEIKDLVKYKTGYAVYEVTKVNDNYVDLIHLGTGKTYSDNPNSLIKLQYKIGDEVEVLKGSHKDTIGTITFAYGEEGIFYRLSTVEGVKFNEKNLKLVTQDSKKQPESTFQKGDLVYIDPNEVEVDGNCYKLWEVIGDDISDYSIECSGNGESSVYLVKSCLKKPVFKKGQFIIIKDNSWVVDNVYFNLANSLCYKIHNPRIGSTSYTEDELLQKIAEDAVTNCKTTVESIHSDAIIAKADKNILISNLEENYGSENQLQGEDSLKRERNDEGGSRVYGRKPKSAIKVGHLGYQKVVGGGKSRISRS